MFYRNQGRGQGFGPGKAMGRGRTSVRTPEAYTSLSRRQASPPKSTCLRQSDFGSSTKSMVAPSMTPVKFVTKVSPLMFTITDEYRAQVRQHAYIGPKGYTIPKSVLNAADLSFLYKDLYMVPEKQGPSFGPALGEGEQDTSAFPVYRENTKKIYVPRFYGIDRYGYPEKDVSDTKASPDVSTSTTNANAGSSTNATPISCTFDKPLRDYQEGVVDSYVSHVRKNPLHTSNGGIITIGCGSGKCLAVDTPILMYDGTIKPVQDVVVGDQLMGDDSTPRNVLTLARGRETMYKVCTGKGDGYTVNESHILTLMYEDEIVDISVLDYLARVAVDRGEKSRWRGFRVPIQFPEVELKYCPYAVGFELGEIYRKFISPQQQTRIDEYLSGCENMTCPPKSNDDIKSYIYERNGFGIPHIYKCNSRKNQLELLAGIIDKSGYYDGYHYIIDHLENCINDDIVFLARSLGFKVRGPNYIDEMESDEPIRQVEIYGENLDQIPVKFANESIGGSVPMRKDCHPYPASDTYPISIEKLPEDDYYGFEIDGNHRFVLGDFTVTHNTVMAIKIISILSKKTLIIVHKEFLLNQWIERIQEFMPTARIGRIQGPVFDSAGKDIVIGMLQTLYDRDFPDGAFDDFGLTIVDEVHRIGSCQFSKALLRIQTPYMLGVTATLERKDGLTKVIHHFIGPTVYSDPAGLQSDDGSVLVRGIEFISDDPEFNHVVTDYRGNTQFSTMITKLCSHAPRIQFLVRTLAELVRETPDAQILVLGHNRCLLVSLHDALVAGQIATVGYYLGGMKQAALEASTGQQIILASYAMASEGFDHKNLSILVMITPKTDIVQSVGRIFRQKHARPLIVDIVDKHETFQNQWRKRRAYYKKCGFRIHQSTNLAPTTYKIVYEPKINASSVVCSSSSTKTNTESVLEEDSDELEDDDTIPFRGTCMILQETDTDL